MERQFFLNSYDWLNINQTSQIIMGDDLDAALATVLYLHLNPNAKLIGIYQNYSKIFFSKDYFQNFNNLINSTRTIWIDLDIYSENCRSLGHHIVRYSNDDILLGFSESCNLNEVVGRSITNNFRLKYPLGTIHFLMWLYEIEMPEFNNNVDALIWLADSAFINAQTHRFRNNVENWIRNIFPLNSLIEMFEQQIDTIDFEERVNDLQNEMRRYGFNEGRGQVSSRHLNLTGFQCQPENIPEDIFKLIDFIINKTNWTINDNQIAMTNLIQINGTRKRIGINYMLNNYGSLDNFLQKENIFSYVFPFRDSINFTIF